MNTAKVTINRQALEMQAESLARVIEATKKWSSDTAKVEGYQARLDAIRAEIAEQWVVTDADD